MVCGAMTGSAIFWTIKNPTILMFSASGAMISVLLLVVIWTATALPKKGEP
jgi:fucose permease